LTYDKWKSPAIVAVSLIVVIYVLGLQLSSLNPFVSSWDQVDFSLAVERYDLRAMQPHFPGYPYFILGGLLTKFIVAEPNQALVLFNILIYASSIIPVYFIASRLISRQSAFMAAAAIYTASYPLIIVNQPMSEGAALAVFWWYFWSIVTAWERKSGKWILLPLFLFSVLLGIRLSYIPLGAGLIYLFYKKWKDHKIGFSGLLKYTLAAGGFQLIWIGGLIITEGGIANFLELAFGFTGGHFQEWGGTTASNDLSIFARIKVFLFTNIFWWGIFSRTHVLMVLYIVIGLFIFLPGTKSKLFKNMPFTLGVVMMSAYGIWALFAQNIDKPRHILPVALILIFLVLSAFFKRYQTIYSRLLILVLLIAQAIVSTNLVKTQANEEPAVYQLARFLEETNEEFVLYTWEETRVLEYMEMPYPHKRINTYKVFLHDQSLYKGKTVYLTGKVVKGFRTQGIEIDNRVEKIKVFDSEKIFDPVYNEIILYKWTP